MDSTVGKSTDFKLSPEKFRKIICAPFSRSTEATGAEEGELVVQ